MGVMRMPMPMPGRLTITRARFMLTRRLRPGPSAAGGAGADHHGSDHPAKACCGTACASAIQAAAHELASPALTRHAVPQLAGRAGSSIDPNGLKRPPRTPSLV
jgi:hypothetical protein